MASNSFKRTGKAIKREAADEAKEMNMLDNRLPDLIVVQASNVMKEATPMDKQTNTNNL